MFKTQEFYPFNSFINDNTKCINLAKDRDKFLPKSGHINEYIEALKHTFQIEVVDNKRIQLNVSEDTITYLEEILNLTNYDSNLSSTDRCNLITEVYRCLRNSATSESIQNYICFQTKILDISKNLITSLESNRDSIKIILQFLINLITLNSIVLNRIHTEFFDLVIELIQKDIHTYECSALIYNISISNSIKLAAIDSMFSIVNSNKNEFVIFFIELCITREDFWNLYTHLKSLNRQIVLDMLKTRLTLNKSCSLPDNGYNCIITSFLKGPDIFFNINSVGSTEAREISLVIEVLSSLSSNDEYVKVLQKNKNIIINAVALLINFHKLGKNGNNMFTPVQKLAESDENEADNPVFGLKANLIRLIGNLCWKNQQMQDLAREADAIPVILDCCNIDTKNPFIIQCCIFATRNICENNPENQKLIASMHREGTVSSRVLDEFGITLNDEGGNVLKIAPLNSIKK